ncbi:MAG TPA: CdaR family protein, partial [Vitreimonas sp.]|nr:CdaR family protein [Vitreimonas sp.]
MTRLLLFLVYNWPLKLAAIVLATLLYGVIVVTQDSRQIPVTVPIEARNQPDDLVRVSNLGSVQEIRYLAPDDVPANSSSFRATVDFAGLNGRDETVLLGVDVTAIDDRIRVISWEPRQINVSIDRLGSREVRISAIRDGELPEGLDVREPQLETDMAEIRGPSSAVARVARVEASYQVEPNGLDIDRVVDLVPVDAQG